MTSRVEDKRSSTREHIVILVAALVLTVLGAATSVDAQYFRNPESDVDPSIFRIDDKKFMGVKIKPNMAMVDQDGQERTFREFLGKPTILVLSYYTCDGSCSAVNSVLKETLEEVEKSEIGQDYRILTLSFDKDDTQESMVTFAEELALSDRMKKGWVLARLKDPDAIKPLTDSLGFKFFWSAQDHTFFHPNVYIFLSPKGRVVRYLYALTNDTTDMELAILDAYQGKFRPNQIIEYAVSLCYSYNFKEGRYTYNIPLFVGVGSFFLGITIFIGSMLYFRNFKKKS